MSSAPPDVIVAVTLAETAQRLDRLLADGRRDIALSDAALATWRSGVLDTVRAFLAWEILDPGATIH